MNSNRKCNIKEYDMKKYIIYTVMHPLSKYTTDWIVAIINNYLLSRAFYWDRSPENYDFWSKVSIMYEYQPVNAIKTGKYYRSFYPKDNKLIHRIVNVISRNAI